MRHTSRFYVMRLLALPDYPDGRRRPTVAAYATTLASALAQAVKLRTLAELAGDSTALWIIRRPLRG